MYSENWCDARRASTQVSVAWVLRKRLLSQPGAESLHVPDAQFEELKFASKTKQSEIQ